MKLKPRKFLKTMPVAGKEIQEFGLVAQEVEEIPELAFAAHTTGDGLKALHDRNVDTLTLAALQDLAKVVKRLAERIDALENGPWRNHGALAQFEQARRGQVYGGAAAQGDQGCG